MFSLQHENVKGGNVASDITTSGKNFPQGSYTPGKLLEI